MTTQTKPQTEIRKLEAEVNKLLSAKEALIVPARAARREGDTAKLSQIKSQEFEIESQLEILEVKLARARHELAGHEWREANARWGELQKEKAQLEWQLVEKKEALRQAQLAVAETERALNANDAAIRQQNERVNKLKAQETFAAGHVQSLEKALV